MTKTNDGGPAFPAVSKSLQTGDGVVWHQVVSEGMTVRDYFAIRALPVAWDALDKGYFEAENYTEATAECAYQMADAMLKAREGK